MIKYHSCLYFLTYIFHFHLIIISSVLISLTWTDSSFNIGKSGSATSLSELIKSKGKLYDAMHKIKDANYGTQDMAVNTSQNSEILVSKVGKAPTASNVPLIATPKTASSGAQVPQHQFNISKPVPSFETVNFPIQFVSPVSGQPLGVSSSSSNKRRKNKKKANKKLCTDAR